MGIHILLFKFKFIYDIRELKDNIGEIRTRPVHAIGPDLAFSSRISNKNKQYEKRVNLFRISENVFILWITKNRVDK